MQEKGGKSEVKAIGRNVASAWSPKGQWYEWVAEGVYHCPSEGSEKSPGA